MSKSLTDVYRFLLCFDVQTHTPILHSHHKDGGSSFQTWTCQMKETRAIRTNNTTMLILTSQTFSVWPTRQERIFPESGRRSSDTQMRHVNTVLGQKDQTIKLLRSKLPPPQADVKWVELWSLLAWSPERVEGAKGIHHCSEEDTAAFGRKNPLKKVKWREDVP